MLKPLSKSKQAKMLTYARSHMFMHKWMGEESFDTRSQVIEILDAFGLAGEYAETVKQVAQQVQAEYFAKVEEERRAKQPKTCFMCYRRPVVVTEEDMCQECYDKFMAEYK